VVEKRFGCSYIFQKNLESGTPFNYTYNFVATLPPKYRSFCPASVYYASAFLEVSIPKDFNFYPQSFKFLSIIQTKFAAETKLNKSSGKHCPNECGDVLWGLCS
jgi:hypothetical protein